MKDIIFEGSGVALITPFSPDMSIDYDKLGELVEFQIENGTNAIIACGTTSESATMTEQEHLDVLKFIIDRVDKRIPVIAGTGSNDTRCCVELSQEAKDLGADGILVVTPYYNKTSQRGLIEHYNYVANEVKMPLILYNVPSRTNLNITPQTYLELSKNPYIVATKEANGDIGALGETIALCGDNLAVYSGEDKNTLPIMAMGGKGCISVFANALPNEFQQLTSALLREDYNEARELANEWYDLFCDFFIDVNPVPVKYAMAKMGLSPDICRMPLVEMTNESKSRIDELLKKHNLI